MKRSKHSLSHYSILTGRLGTLTPLSWYEVLAGDTVQQSSSVLLRMLPLVAPVMHPLKIRIHTFFVPNRIIWDNWEKFITGGDGIEKIPHPYITLKTDLSAAVGSLYDYMGIPLLDYTGDNFGINALPFRAYNAIYNEHYADQDLINPLVISKSDGEDTDTTISHARVAWEKDYITAARPTEQKGVSPVINIGDSAPIKLLAPGGPVASGPKVGIVDNADANIGLQANQSGSPPYVNVGSTDVSPDAMLIADLSAATGITVNDLRESLALQRFMEARQNFGSRYIEYLRYLIGPAASRLDGRLQNPEYLGGGTSLISFSEVLGTNQNDEIEPTGRPLGELGGHGIAALRTRRFRRFIPEHGIVMTLMSVVPKAVYTTAFHKKWRRFDNMQYFQKELQWLGDQEVFNYEVQGEHSNREGRWGYQQRYDDYRSHPSSVHGLMRTTLNHWHLGREFVGDVALNKTFIECQPSTRISADTEGHTYTMMSQHSIQTRRLLARNPQPRTF